MIVNFDKIYHLINYLNIDYQLKRYINLSQQKPSKYIKNYYASIVPLIALLWFDINSLMLTLSPLLSTIFRIIMCDTTLIYHLSQNENFSFASLCLAAICFQLNLNHSQTFPVLNIMHNILSYEGPKKINLNY